MDMVFFAGGAVYCQADRRLPVFQGLVLVAARV